MPSTDLTAIPDYRLRALGWQLAHVESLQGDLVDDATNDILGQDLADAIELSRSLLAGLTDQAVWDRTVRRCLPVDEFKGHDHDPDLPYADGVLAPELLGYRAKVGSING